MSIDKKFLKLFTKVTEKAAIGASKYIGKNDKIAADKGAVDPMRRELNKINMEGTVVIGEGEMDEAPMLYIGEKLGTLNGPKFDIAVDPLEGTKFTANGEPNAFSVLAISEKGGLLSAPDSYMEKIVIGSNLPKNLMDIDNGVENNIKLLAKAKNKKVKSISLNDIVVNNRGILKMIDMNIYVNNNLITKQRSDGVIISTPTGSTAYAMSNGCPIVSPNSNVICIVPIAPHSYGQRSVIINNTDNVSIQINKKSVNNSQVTFDGANNLTIENPTSIEIKKANKQLMIVHPCDYDYFKALSKKLKYEIKS